ncbi:MAG: discoidin domain-containing protein [Acidobacteriota bacterium]|nr:discoidin domain-containing protein [Acidobacteriota bacterium]
MRAAHPTLFREEEHFFRFLTGSACFSLLIFCLTAAGQARVGVFTTAGSALMAAAWHFRSRAGKPLPLPDFPLFWKVAFWSVVLAYGVSYFVHALAPEMSPDGSTYHLGLVSRYLRQHGFGHITSDMYANLSEGIEMLFLAAFSIGRHSAAALVEFAFLLALPWGILCYARRIGFPAAGVLAAALVYASPVFGISGSSAYNDAAGVCILFGTFYLLQIWNETREPMLIPFVGLLAGFCYAAKYTLFLAVPFAGCFILVQLLRSRRPILKHLLIFSGCALLTILPWMTKNWITVQNPFSPFANSLFPNPYITKHFEREYSDMMRHREGLAQAERPLDHIVTGGKTSGLLGPAFLLAPLALLALRFAAGRQLLLASAIFLLPAFTNVETRFLMPMAPFLALALGLALVSVPGGIALVLAFHALTCWPAVVRGYSSPYAWRIDEFRPAESFRLVPEQTTLRKRMPSIEIDELLDRRVPPSGRVFCLSNPPEAYTSREILVRYESALGNQLGDFLNVALIPDFQPTGVVRFAIPEQKLRRIRIVQTATHAADTWNTAEIRVFDKSGEIRRDPSWRLRASVNPWNLPLAFDNDPVTRWSTEEPIRPGMYVEMDFGQSLPVTGVTLESARDQWSVRLRLESEAGPGQWKILSENPTQGEQRLPSNLRQDAMLEFKARGITHLLISKGDYGWEDYAQNQKLWGIAFEGEAQGSRLYRIL